MEICAENTRGPVVAHRALMLAVSCFAIGSSSNSALSPLRRISKASLEDSALKFSTFLPCRGCGLHDRHRLVPSSLPAIR